MNDVERRIYQKAMGLWGFHFQALMLCEEFGELIKAINHYSRGNRKGSINSIAGEIADCEIMLEQFQVILSIDRCLIDIHKDAKLCKLKELIKEGEAVSNRLFFSKEKHVAKETEVRE